MIEVNSRLSSTLAERYKIELHLGEGDAIGSPASTLPCNRKPTGTTRLLMPPNPTLQGC
jgi:hypothetical protein